MTDRTDDQAERQARETQEVARLVKSLRTRAGFTQQQLADRMTADGNPTKRAQVTHWESGRQAPSSYNLLSIFRATRRPRAREQLEAEIAELEDRMAGLQDDLARMDRDT